MGLLVLGAAKGAPGVTTAALALAALWPRDVLLADCDPAGGDVALRMPDPDGNPLDPDRGLVSLAAAGRNGLAPALLRAHAQQVSGGLEVLAGLRAPEQAPGLGGFWPAFADVALTLTDADVVADVGRLDPRSPAQPVVRAADVVVLVCRPALASVVHVRERLGTLVPLLSAARTHRALVGVLLVADPQGERDARAAVETLNRTATPPDRIWRLAFDPRGAAVFDGQEVRRPERTDLARSAVALADELAALLPGRHAPVPEPAAQPAVQPAVQPMAPVQAPAGEDAPPGAPPEVRGRGPGDGGIGSLFDGFRRESVPQATHGRRRAVVPPPGRDTPGPS